eukprot:Protomagalhaensia_sp_Gyna_25__1454@NODE_1737_length_1575_cov_24_162109_g1336_i1_p1_GENE_NODE_1737_length_1575_cov_24_162109_g1336_i1NODE_1737_length_1575_cov_24_162109_g1336_i1_p1_ORF_typecomplete_len333_score18_68_NODE_1737_length_1575_cov_24_162109_g1336_i14701468
MVLSIVTSPPEQSSSCQKSLLLATVISRSTVLQDQAHHPQFEFPLNYNSRPFPLHRRRLERQVHFNETPQTSIVHSSAVRFVIRDPTRSMFSTTEPSNASVSAGNYSLLVDGNPDPVQGNRGFANELKSTKELIGSVHLAAYQEALRKLRLSKSTSVHTSLLTKLSVDGSQSLRRICVRLVPELSYDRPAGTVLIDVFGPRAAPNPNAMAMVYLVGPDGRQPVYDANPKKFLRAVELTAANFVLALNEYNRAYRTNPIQSVRLCLFSAGRFKHPGVTVQELSQRILQTILKKRVCGVTPEIHCVDFPRNRSSQPPVRYGRRKAIWGNRWTKY